MKVLLLVHSLVVGGAEAMIAYQARSLRAGGDAVEIGCLGALGPIGEELRADGFRVVVHARRPGFDATLPWRLARRVRAERFDIVHAHQRTALFYGLLAGLLHAAPFAYTEHGPLFGLAANRRQRLFNRLLGRRAGCISTVSCDLARSLAAHEGFAGRAIEVVPNGVDVARWAAASGDGRDAARARCRLPRHAAIIGSVGRLDAVKNQPLLVRVIADLRQRIPDARLVLVGDGPQRESLAARAGQLGVADAVHFLGERRDVEQILPAFDVFCLTSLSEGIPLTLLEAMAARVPVVAVAAGGIPEAVRPEREALLVGGAPADKAREERSPEEREVAQFAAAVERVLGDAALRHRLTEHAFARVRADFAIDTICERYRQLLAGAIRGGTA